jgi:hypothetical protein
LSEPVIKEDYEDMNKWEDRTDLTKIRARTMAMDMNVTALSSAS